MKVCLLNVSVQGVRERSMELDFVVLCLAIQMNPNTSDSHLVSGRWLADVWERKRFFFRVEDIIQPHDRQKIFQLSERTENVKQGSES